MLISKHMKLLYVCFLSHLNLIQLQNRFIVTVPKQIHKFPHLFCNTVKNIFKASKMLHFLSKKKQGSSLS